VGAQDRFRVVSKKAQGSGQEFSAGMTPSGHASTFMPPEIHEPKPGIMRQFPLGIPIRIAPVLNCDIRKSTIHVDDTPLFIAIILLTYKSL